MASIFQNIRNFFQTPTGSNRNGTTGDVMTSMFPGQEPNKRAPMYPITRVQFERIRVDVNTWRDAINHAESAYNPNRVAMQRIFQDTSLNEHVEACKKRRKNLTMLRKFKICDAKGVENEDITKLFQKTWFSNFQSYALDALFYGYNLIQLGDYDEINGVFPNLKFVRRQNINPDRKIVTNMILSITGTSIDDPIYKPWYVYITTPSETGVTPCGYGLMYRIARTEIFLRNNSGQNADYNETFGQPIRVGKTSKADEERNQFDNALRTMGANPYILLDEMSDSIELVESSGSGRAFETYKDFELRCQAKISKVFLGHADAIDSTPGKLGAGQNNEESPVNKALMDIQTEDAEFLQPIINNELIPRMRDFGFLIPDDLHFEYKNDDEKEAFRKKEDASNKETADIMKTIADAGGNLDEKSWKYFTDRTGIPVAGPIPPPAPPMMPGMKKQIDDQKTVNLKNQMAKVTDKQKQLMNGKAKHLT